MSFAWTARVWSLLQRKSVLIPLLMVAMAALMISRRGDTIFHPSVWDEDGDVILRDLLNGASPINAIFGPVGGYLNVVARLLDLLAFQISATQFALIEAILGHCFAIGVGVIIALAPTHLRWRPLAALSVFLVPSDPEVFGTTLYTFWWAGLLLCLLPIWRRSTDWRNLASRLAIVTICGLSSPMILVVAPLLAVRAIYLILRRRDRWVEPTVAAAGIVIAIIQGLALLSSGTNTPLAMSGSLLHNLAATIRQFFGGYLIRAWTTGHFELDIAGAVLLLVLAGGVFLLQKHRAVYLALLLLLIGSIGVSVVRAGSPDFVDPILAGPRYFFYPFVLLSWTLLFLVTRSQLRWLSLLPAAAVALSAVNASGGWVRPSPAIAWAQELSSCTSFETYPLKVQFDGNLDNIWTTTVSGKSCSDWLARDPFFAAEPIPTYPYGIKAAYGGAPDYTPIQLAHDEPSAPPAIAASVGVVGRALDLGAGPIANSRVIRSDGDAVSYTFELHRGQSVLMQTSPDTTGISLRIEGATGFAQELWPSLHWSNYDFANLHLPDEFAVTVTVPADDDRWVALVVANE